MQPYFKNFSAKTKKVEMGILATIETNINGFIKSNPRFKESCEAAFKKFDKDNSGSISLDEASKAVDAVLDGLEDDLDSWGGSAFWLRRSSALCL